MRNIIRMIQEFAVLDNKSDNDRCAQIREAYEYIDANIDHVNRAGSVNVSVQEALVVGDFSTYFARTLSRMVYDRYKYREGTWRDYTYDDTVPDYTTADRWRWSEFDRLVLRREKQEARTGYLYPERVQIAVEDYAKQIDFSRRILINDDLGQFRDVGRKMGDSARRFEDFYVSALYDNALSQAALVALGANYAGTGALTTANLMIAVNAYAQRTDARGNPLNIVPKYLVIPPILQLTANTILESERIAELATNAKNVLRGSLEVRVDPYIGFTLPNVPWYLFADPMDVPGVSVARMTNVPGPQLYAKAPDKLPMSATGALGAGDWRLGSFLTGDIELEIETTIGSRTDDLTGLVGITDAQGIYYSSGTTP